MIYVLELSCKSGHRSPTLALVCLCVCGNSRLHTLGSVYRRSRLFLFYLLLLLVGALVVLVIDAELQSQSTRSKRLIDRPTDRPTDY